MIVLIDGEAVREDISTDDLEQLAIASVLESEEDKHAALDALAHDLVETAQEWAPRDAEFDIDMESVITEIVSAFHAWFEELSVEEKKELAEKIADAEVAAA